MKDPTVWRTPHGNCPACSQQHLHTENELKTFHPFSKHGFDRGQWTHRVLEPWPPLTLRGDSGENGGQP